MWPLDHGRVSQSEGLYLPRVASMGPRLFRRGNHGLGANWDYKKEGFNGATPFQTWKQRVGFLNRDRTEASMGPRLFRRGNAYCANVHEAFYIASMGPRLFRRGNRSRR